MLYYGYTDYGETEDYAIVLSTGSNMAYSSGTTVQASTSNLSKSDIYREILGIQVVTTGSCSAISLTEIKMQMAGTSPTTDVSKIHIFYTGTSSTYSPISPFDGGGTDPASGTITISGSQALSNGTNYFWVTYDVNPNATTSNTLDAKLLASPTTTLTVGGSAQTVTANDPAGSRTITACNPTPGGVGYNYLKLWLKPSAGTGATDGGQITTWTDQSSNAYGATASGTTSKPILRNNSSQNINFNPYIEMNSSYVNYFTLTNPATSDFSFYSIIKTSQSGNNTFWLAPSIYGGDVGGSPNPVDFCITFNSSGKPLYGQVSTAAVDFTLSNASATAINTNKYLLVAADRTINSANSLTLANYLNGSSNYSGTSTATGAGATTMATINIGAHMDGSYPLNGSIGEFFTFSINLPAYLRNRVDSYLAIKYGITLGGNGSTSVGYTNTSGTTIWTANSGYHYDVTGIGAESTVEGLQQNKSMSINVPSAASSTDMPFTIAHDDITTPTNIDEGTYIIVGHNNGTISGTAVSYTHGSTSIAIVQNRIFRIQTTGLSGGKSLTNLKVQFDMSQVNGSSGNGLGGSNDPTNLRLLLDDNTTFGQGIGADANERAYAYSTVSGNVITFAIPVGDLPTTGVYYFRMGSIATTNTPLPLEMGAINISCIDSKGKIEWKTYNEINTNFFEIQTSSNGTNFESIAKINAHINSNTIQNYQYLFPSRNEISYIQLEEVDLNGNHKIFGPYSINCKETDFQIYPNPTNSDLYIQSFSNSEVFISIQDNFGRIVFVKKLNLNEDNHINIEQLSSGSYTITMKGLESQKIINFIKL
ncbi:MAG: T9SS type A sorting domain-containing protein [Flavobacteriia bacterium]|nr:T9SS type A sorting domain-containing protein [Flavobacteriia bacterium]